MRKIALVLSLCLLSCYSETETRKLLNVAGTIMTDNPREAKSLLETIDAPQIRRASLKARYALLYSQALDKNYIDKTDDSLISFAVNYYERKGTDRDRALAHYYHGRIYENGNDVENAIRSFVLSEGAAVRGDDCYLSGLVNYSIGHLYVSQYSFSEALDKFRRAVGYFNKAGAKYNEALVLSHMARTYFLVNECDSAHKKLNEAIEKYKSIREDNEILKLYEKIAAIRLERHENLDSLKRILHNCYLKTNSGEIPIPSLGLWQAIYMKENKLDSARMCGNRILKNRILFTDHQIAGCLARMGAIEYSAGNYERAYRCRVQHEAIKDSIYNETRDHIIQELEQKYNNRILEAANKNFLVRQKYQIIIIVLLVVILVFGSILIARGFVRWRKKVRYRIRCADTEIGRLRATYSELLSQYEAIRTKVGSDDEKEAKLMAALNARLQGLRDLVENTRSTKSAAFVKLFHRYMKVNVRSDISLSDLQYVVNKNYHGIIDYLEANYPKLTRQDLDLCSLLCFGFSQYGICYIYETEIQTFYNKRHRLRERLGLKQNQKIEVFIRELIKNLGQETSL